MTDHSWTDEQLSAFIDGELAASETDALAQDLERDPQLAARMERLGSANATYVDAISQIDRAPMSAALKAVIERPPVSSVVAFKPRSFMAFVMEHRAIAASLLCAAAVWGVMSTAVREASPDLFGPGPEGVIVASSPLHQLLESAPTGQVRTVGKETAVPRLTFAADDGAFCRQFDIAHSKGASAAIACRKDGAWRVQVIAYGLVKPVGDFQTAAAARPHALETFLDEHMSGAPMNAEEEARLLQNRWAQPER